MLPASADAINGLVFVMAEADVIRGKAGWPLDRESAREEGWIWAAEAAGAA